MVGPEETVDYLGLTINSWKGPRQPDVAALVEDMGQKISQARLKPSQRVEIFCTYAIPRVFYRAINCTFRSTCMRQVDLTIRRYVKNWLHLSPGTADGLLYSRWNDGGMAVPCLGKIIPRCKAKQIFSLYHSEDPVTSGMAKVLVTPGQFCKLWLAGGGKEDQKPLALQELMENPLPYPEVGGMRSSSRGLGRDPNALGWISSRVIRSVTVGFNGRDGLSGRSHTSFAPCR